MFHELTEQGLADVSRFLPYRKDAAIWAVGILFTGEAALALFSPWIGYSIVYPEIEFQHCTPGNATQNSTCYMTQPLQDATGATMLGFVLGTFIIHGLNILACTTKRERDAVNSSYPENKIFWNIFMAKAKASLAPPGTVTFGALSTVNYGLHMAAYGLLGGIVLRKQETAKIVAANLVGGLVIPGFANAALLASVIFLQGNAHCFPYASYNFNLAGCRKLKQINWPQISPPRLPCFKQEEIITAIPVSQVEMREYTPMRSAQQTARVVDENSSDDVEAGQQVALKSGTSPSPSAKGWW